jgi:aryl-alcohol dehydrogenase-like predicted oxidoreductase
MARRRGSAQYYDFGPPRVAAAWLEERTMSRIESSRWSRRLLMQTGLLAGATAALPYSLLAAQGNLPLIAKPIPSTGEKIPVMGVGTNQFGRTDYTAVRDVLKRMYELGGTVIDTAAGYGESEAQIGKALEELGLTQKMFIVTKFNGGGYGGPLFGKDSVERSFQRLKKIDLLFIHMVDSVDSQMPLLADLKKQGRVKYIGITSTRGDEYPRIAQFMRKYPMDIVQMKYSLEDRAVEKEVLPLALEKKIGIQVAQPFDGARNSLITKAGSRPLPPWAADYDITTWGQFFLKYVASHPAVISAVPGSTKISHIEDNQQAGRGRMPDAAGRTKMEEFWASVA